MAVLYFSLNLAPASEIASFDKNLWCFIQKNLPTSHETLMTASSVTLCGTHYKPGSYIVLGGDQYNLQFGQLLHIVVESGHEATPLFLVKKAASAFLPNFRLSAGVNVDQVWSRKRRRRRGSIDIYPR